MRGGSVKGWKRSFGAISLKDHRGLLRDGAAQVKGEGRVCGKCGRPGGLREDVPGEISCLYCGHLEFES